MSNGVFIVSLDFELHWGGFEKWPLESYKQYFLNTRRVIPQILNAFHDFEVHATWATVGMLFHDRKESLLKAAPPLRPSYKARELSAYEFINKFGIGDSENEDPFHFGKELVQKIGNTPFQEIGSHTFAHYYCNEEGQTLDEFRADLQAAQRSASMHNLKLRSLVFPRNQFNESYLRVCFEEGFLAVRDNPKDWFWSIQGTQNESFWKRLVRGTDAYFSVGKKGSFAIADLANHSELPVSIPASRLFRPYNPKELFLNELKITRIKEEMEWAARAGEAYHLWWHPHNFGHYPVESMVSLKKILNHYAFCKEKYEMESLHMAEVAEQVLQNS